MGLKRRVEMILLNIFNYVIVIAKETIQIGIDEETTKFVNRLIRSGFFKTKSDAIRYILSIGMTATNKFPEVSDKIEKLKLMERSIGMTHIYLKFTNQKFTALQE
jgi:hypothetical protein